MSRQQRLADTEPSPRLAQYRKIMMTSEEWKVIEELEVKSNEDGFWKGLGVWIDRPHILNKRLCAVNEIACWSLKRLANSQEPLLDSLAPKLRKVQLEAGPNDFDISINESRVEEVLGTTPITYQKLGSIIDKDSLILRLRQHLPKRSSKHGKVFEIIIKDSCNSTIIFLPLLSSCKVDEELAPVSPLLAYAVRYSSKRIQFLILNSEIGSCDVSWMVSKVLPKICQWINETAKEPIPGRKMLASLSLVSTSRYSLLYNDLKLKYGKHLVEIWPERTDPTKFVYQIIAVASYLIVLWEEESKKSGLSSKQNFVDLGCGNGLLTHILCSEGHSGIGIDVKRRKIWDLYGPETKLLEQPIVPSSRDLFPEYDWIIGSHSDELTPWIPVIAARSSRRTKFFLLPCCAHNFDCKFQRRNSKVSIYEDYMDFVEEVAAVCGFETKKDKLRIPSTKRICFVGFQRSYSVEDWPNVDANITSFISNQCSRPAKNSVSEENGEFNDDLDKRCWVSNFQARNPVQEVRNCTRLNSDLKTFIVKTAVVALLEADVDATEVIRISDREQQIWHKGGRLELADLAAKIPNDSLQKLKSEFGGLKTLLRNHYHIFGVNQTRVTLRNYKAETPFPRKRKTGKPGSTNPSTAKTKQCWFEENHPDGCPLSSEDCYFIHRQSCTFNTGNGGEANACTTTRK